jgi:hypothetical protein
MDAQVSAKGFKFHFVKRGPEKFNFVSSKQSPKHYTSKNNDDLKPLEF